MKKGMLKAGIFLFLVCTMQALRAQVPVYVSTQTGETSKYNGGYSKQTDRYEQGAVNLSTTGPITYQVTPGEFSIQPNQNKSWNGHISGVVAAAPAAGTVQAAQLIVDYDIQYSRPYGVGTNGTVLSTYYCSNNGSAGGEGGCTFHGGNPGAHEMVNDVGQRSLDFNVFSIKVSIGDTVCLGPTGERAITATSFPAQGGSFEWSTDNSNVQLTNANQQTATIKLLDTTIKNATVKVKYTIEGVSYETTGVLSTCDCTCKPITTGIDAGPLHLTFAADPSPTNPDPNGNCQYASNDAGFTMTLDGGQIQRTVKVENNANVTFGKNCETGKYTTVKVDWTGAIEVPELEIKGVKTFSMTVKEIHVSVDTDGNLGGSVTVNVKNPQDRDLSLGKKFVMLRKGTNSDITFAFNNTNGWAGSWDFSGIQGIVIDLAKQSDNQEVILANFTGDMDNEGTLTGDFTVNANPSYKTNLFKVTLLELQLGMELKIPGAEFRLTSGKGKVQVSEMKAITGTIDLGLEIPEAGGCVASIAAADIKAFTMTLQEFNLQADFNRDFDLTKIEGSLKAKHDKFDAAINVQKFKIETGSLKEFECSGKVKYSSFSFTLEKATYAPIKLSITAKVEISATGTAAMLAVENFTIDEQGAIAITKISGNLDRAPAKIAFSATFGNSRFTGTFSGDFATIGLDGSVDIGVEGEGEAGYMFAYLGITAKVNVPLGQSGLKLTQVGGKVGYNYKLEGVNGPGNPNKGTYIVGLKLGVADVGNMCEVTGETMIQFGNGAIDITLAGTVAVLKDNTFFTGKADVTYKIPAQTLSGSVSTEISIPGSGWMFKSENLKISFFFGNNKFTANGANMGGKLFGDKIKLTNGTINLGGDLSNVAALTGNLGGKASAAFSYGLSQTILGTTFSGQINLNMNSDVNMGFDQNGLSGGFNVTVNGSGNVSVSNYITTININTSATCTGSVSYTNGTLTLTGNLEMTLPISVPVWYNGDWTPTLTDRISTGTISISI